MSSITKVHVKKDSSDQYDLLITGVQDGQNKFSVNKNLTDLSNQSIQSTLKGEKKFATDKKRIVIYNNGPIKKIALYGYVKQNNTDKIRSLASDIASYSNLNKVSSIAIDARSFSITGKNLQAFVEGLMIGSYQFLNYKPKSKGNTLADVTLIGSVDQKIVVRVKDDALLRKLEPQINAEGLIEPLTVEDLGNDQYLLLAVRL